MLSVPAFFVGGLGPTSNVVCCLGDPSKVMMGSGNGFGWRARRIKHQTASKWFAGAWELVRTYMYIRTYAYEGCEPHANAIAPLTD